MKYHSGTLMIRTLRGASLWLALWGMAMLIGMTVLLPNGPVWPRLVAVLIPVLLTGRMIHKLHQWERSGNPPGEAETFLFDLTILLPMLSSVMLAAYTRA